MSPRTCPQCQRRVVVANTRDGEELELVQQTSPRLWGLKSEPVTTPEGRRHVNVAFKAMAYIEHPCSKELDTLGAEAKVIEFPSLGDPANPPTTSSIGDEL